MNHCDRVDCPGAKQGYLHTLPEKYPPTKRFVLHLVGGSHKLWCISIQASETLSALVSSPTHQRKQALLRQLGSISIPKTLAQLPSARDVQRGLRRNEFNAYLQSKFDLRTGNVNSAEVLARWHHPLYGVLSPATFIPVMERESGSTTYCSICWSRASPVSSSF